MKKAVRDIIQHLNKYHLISLSPEELRTYVEYRIEKLVSSKLVLLPGELQYLLCETGPGNIRLNPRFLKKIKLEPHYISPILGKLPDVEMIVNKKKSIEEYVQTHNDKADALKGILPLTLPQEQSDGGFLNFDGQIDGTPVRCLVANGKWIYPDSNLFLFLKKCQEDQVQPLIVAKKIHGILFPIFKQLGVMGLSTYKTFLPAKARSIVEIRFSEETYLEKIKYHDQFLYGISATAGSDPIGNFFNETVRDRLALTYKTFTTSPVSIRANLEDTVTQFRTNKAVKALLLNFRLSEDLLNAL